MHADPAGVMNGSHFLDGDHACCEGALAAGARFSSGYPITPSTEVAATALFRMHDMRRMVPLRIESGGERQHVRGTELHAKATGFAALDHNRNTSFCHESPQFGYSEVQRRRM